MVFEKQARIDMMDPDKENKYAIEWYVGMMSEEQDGIVEAWSVNGKVCAGAALKEVYDQ